MDLQPTVADTLRAVRQTFLSQVIEGLSRPQKMLASKFLYDDHGSQLFNRICELDEYYLTRAELAIMRTHVEEIAALVGARTRLVELGSGSGLKTRLLLGYLEQLAAYVPVDICPHEIRRCLNTLATSFPHLDVLPVYADYTENWSLPLCLQPFERTLVYFPGSTIGNFTPQGAQHFLARLRPLCAPSGALLIGVDLKKDALTLDAAYNDAAGVTAAFNLNLLTRLNRELNANFNLEDFTHRAFYAPDHSRVEMHLVSRREQDIHIGPIPIHFEKGESILTEYSYKYDLDRFASLARSAGFEPARVWVDANEQFSVWYLEAEGS
ncbi:MAG: L-histidine N(alpha)-methyltransferase [Bradymonadaceae bacterium]|nr:L-histidine N(alpha)-methyltransferase [Lujinxingiaceae bacterium]